MLEEPAQGGEVKAFLEATYEGWRRAMIKPGDAIRSVRNVCDKVRCLIQK
jgi:hypothetical protein